ncbi:MAG: CotH kinase family protein [Eubacteriales bacterium]
MTDHDAVIKYPKGVDCTEKQKEYISTYANEANKAIMKKQWDEILNLVDIDTFVDNFIVTEIMLNNDMGWNFFFYKPAGGKLCLGPHWDFDQASGASAYGGETYEGWSAGSPHPCFEALVQIDEFIELLRKRWTEKYDFIHSIPEKFIDEKEIEYQYDIAANFTRWKVFGVRHWRSVRSLDQETTYQGHIDYLKTWLTNR